MNNKIDLYLANGCGRCEFYATSKCKVHDWHEELKLLRKIVLECGLDENLKWGMPCYTIKGKNVVMISAFREFSALNFFKGSLIEDKSNLLSKPGENSQSARFMKFTDVKQIIENESIIREYIQIAAENEKSGKKVEFKKSPEPIPDELAQKFLDNPEFEEAFFRLTPGRQRGYIIFFSQPKQSVTRTSRIEKCLKNILDGKGIND